MNITKSASILDWRTNTQGRWTAVVDDIAPSTQDISFGNGYTAIVTNRKITVENPTRPYGTVTYAVEDVDNTAYAGSLAAVGSVKDTLDVVTGERTSKTVTVTLNGTENWKAYSYVAVGWHNKGFYLENVLFSSALVLPYVVDGDTFGIATPSQRWEGSKPSIWVGSNNTSLYVVWDTTLNPNIPELWYDPSTDTLNVAGFKAWLAENPVTVTYAPPANQQLESIEDTPQPLSLSAGSNTASMTDTSTGDKPSFPMSYDGTDYTISTKSTRVYLKDVDGTVERVTGVTSIPVRGGRDNVMDLTRMFGSGLEPGTLDAFYSLFPAWRGYKLPYNEGSLLNFRGTGLKSVGFNQFSGVYSEEGKYLKTDGTLGASSNYNVTDYLRVIPEQVYRLTARGQNNPSLCWYTYDKTLVSGIMYENSGSWQEHVFTAPANAYWVRFSVYMPREAETCFYFQWSGTRNGDYEPYWDYTRPIPTLTYFPGGMNGRGDVYDEINDRQAIRRFGVVDMGTLEWIWQSGGDYGYWRSSSIQNSIKIPSTTSTVASVISDYYSATSQSTIGGSAEKAGLLAITSTGSIYINTGSTTESPSGWLVYELATPIVTTFSEEISTTARISDFGTEECLPANGYDPITAPFRGMVLYQDDYARTITKLPENYQSQESMANLLELLGQLHNGTIGTVFDAASQSYKYNFTPNA